MTREEAEKQIEEYLIKIRDIVLQYGMTSDVFNMYISDSHVSGWMFDENKNYTLNVVKFIERGIEE